MTVLNVVSLQVVHGGKLETGVMHPAVPAGGVGTTGMADVTLHVVSGSRVVAVGCSALVVVWFWKGYGGTPVLEMVLLSPTELPSEHFGHEVAQP